MTRDWLVTCVPGLEDIAALEAVERLDANVLAEGNGTVRFETDASPERLLELRSVEHLQIFLGEFLLGPDPEASIRAALLAVDPDPFLSCRSQSNQLQDPPRFRITGRRAGDHEFTSEDLQRWAGASIFKKFGWPVSLEEFDLEIYVRVEDDRAWIAGRLPGGPGRKRSWQVANHPSAINPLIAYGMLRIAEVRPGDRVLDAFCGGGTLLVEGALLQPEATWIGGDRTDTPPRMTRANAESAGVRVAVVQNDARRLCWQPNSFDLVLSNLPFGRRSGSHRANRKTYFPFFGALPDLLRPGGRAVVLTVERRLMEQVLEECPLELLHQRTVNQSGLYPSIYVLRPLPNN